MATEIAMLHDVTKCSGCRGCTVACKQWNGLPADKPVFTGNFQAPSDLTINTYNLILMREKYENDTFNWYFCKFQCMHCGNPGCVKACPSGALSKLDNGVVAFDKELCIGCGYCATNCPFGVPKIDDVAHKSTKCDLCRSRIDHNMVPACAKTCTSDAILFGTREEMTKIAEARLEAIKPQYPEAQLYGVSKDDGVGGTSMMYILGHKPSVYGMEENPKVSPSLKVWKDIVQPGGKILIGVAAVAVAGAAIASNMSHKKSSSDKGDK